MKSKYLAIVILAGLSASALMESCATSKEYSASGTVQAIEFGKDGYTASLKDKDENDFDALISVVRMQKDYKVLKVGDKIELSGDTIHLDNKTRILVKKIK
ncbi:hypothetical protein L0657_09175 [Dyadobacter sp. CY345]|uniref:hypothetical protein n=1 Tax=Dyadobacter sp. CY345 TaxID=2909335 RepID=UPI001F2274B4|nr:hypothetical protein [Dyadobacter sp. CY345]MCF2444127.1 hypothetical protein [Dyadobacter sp. CY345]